MTEETQTPEKKQPKVESKQAKQDFFKRLLDKVDTLPTTSKRGKSTKSRRKLGLLKSEGPLPQKSLQGTKLNMLSILGRARKTLEMVYLEVNLSRKALGLDLIPRKQCKIILDQLEDLGLVTMSKTPQSYYYLTEKADPYL